MAQLLDDTFDVGPRTIRVVNGSITALGERVNAAVSSDDNYLSHGGGVSRALWAAAGPSLKAHVAREQPALRLGDVHVTPAFSHDADAILHAVSIDFDQNRRVSAGAEIAALYRRVFVSAERAGFSSLALPLLASGAGRLTVAESVAGLVNALAAWFAGPSPIRRVVVAVVGDGFRVARKAIRNVSRQVEPLEWLLQQFALGYRGPHGQRVEVAWRRLVETPPAERGPALCTLFDRTLEAAAASWVQGLADRIAGGTLSPSELAADDPVLASIVSTPTGDAARTVTSSLESLSAPELLRAFTASRRALGQPVPAAVEAGLAAAILARNRLAHESQAGPGADVYDQVSIAFHDLLARIRFDEVDVLASTEAMDRAPNGTDVEEDRSAAGARDERLLPVDEARDIDPIEALPQSRAADGENEFSLSSVAARPIPRQLALGLPAASLAGTARATPGISASATEPSSGTEHVRRLHRFLLEQLDSESRRLLERQFDDLGYQGAEDLRLLEHCIRVANPVEFVAGEFPRSHLAEVVTKSGQTVSAGRSASDLAHDILAQLGFPKRVRPRGLAAARAAVNSARADVMMGDEPRIRGAVTGVATHLEHVSHVLLRFLCQAIYRKSPEQVFAGRVPAATATPLARAGLGKLFGLLGQLKDKLEQDHEVAHVVFGQDVRQHRVFPKGFEALPELRNSFVHFRPDGDAGANLAELRSRADAFLAGATGFLDYLAAPDTRVFPRLILVDRIEVDAWRRRTVRATDDEGRAELIFTDTPLEPGQVYFMHPLSNPLRVDPLLVSAGDLVWPEETG